MSLHDVRSLITWDREKEVAIFNSFVTTLSLGEYAKDDFVLPIEISMGELRNHVQWCQQAARLVESGAQAQNYFVALEQNLHILQRHISSLEHMLQSAGVDPPARPSMRKYGETNTERRA